MRPAQQDDRAGNAAHAQSALTPIAGVRDLPLKRELCNKALRSGYFEPLQVFNPLVSLTIITMATIGGSDDAPGPLLGTIFLVGLSELLWSTAPQLYMVILGALLIFFVLNAPDGLYGRLRPYLPQLK
jgi:ABC-type branched-subunit amino acid transport system permease subunit